LQKSLAQVDGFATTFATAGGTIMNIGYAGGLQKDLSREGFQRQPAAALSFSVCSNSSAMAMLSFLHSYVRLASNVDTEVVPNDGRSRNASRIECRDKVANLW